MHPNQCRDNDKVYWGGRPESPQPPPKSVGWWMTLVLTLALGALAAGIALIL